MLKPFAFHIKNNLNFLLDQRLLLAISGGLDSVVLTYLCQEIKLNFSLAHCNFNLRGEESDQDESFVEELADSIDVDIFIQHFDTKTYAKENKLSTQMAARALRYHWFYDLSEQLGFDYILTAHHADDNLETFLINLSRGSGLDGLTGIPEINGKIVRPLLNFTRKEIEDYALENRIAWREDSSNASNEYLRNKLRHEVIPTLKNLETGFMDGFKKSLNFLSDSREIIMDRIDEVSQHVISEIGEDKIVFNVEEMLKLNNPNIYVYQLLREYKFTQWEDIYDLLYSQSGKQIFSDEYRLLKNRGELILTRIENKKIENDIVINKFQNNEISFGGGFLKFELDPLANEPNSRYILKVDEDKLIFPLTIRKWKSGDFLYPLGMNGKKKLSKYFKDEKFSLVDKENTWLLCSKDNIVWIIGRRMDERFKITDKTERILQIEYIES